MVLLQALFAALARSAGRLLNTAFAWATVLLFGRVSQDRQIYVSMIAFGSVIWLVALIGVAFPVVGTFVLSFVPLPDWVDKKWVRIAMLAAVVVLPLLVGLVAIQMHEKSRRPGGAAATVKAILKGYPYTIGLATTLSAMTILAPVIKIRALSKRWTSEHVPVVIESKDYVQIVEAVQRALATGDVPTEVRRASWMLRLPTKLLTFFAGDAVSDLIAENMAMLSSKTVEVILHPSDLIINGRATAAAHARAIIAERLVFTPAYLTWDKQAHELEDRMRAVWRTRQTRELGELDRDIRAIERDLRRLEVPYEEWDVLFRELLLLERALNLDRSPGAISTALEAATPNSIGERLVSAIVAGTLVRVVSIVVTAITFLVAPASRTR
jgi:hypothetical protein